MMTPELCATLHSVAGAMASFPDGWWIIGSAALTLHGIDAGPVGDVDLLIEAGLADAVFDRLGITPVVLPPDPLFRSTAFARCGATLVPVEVMAGLDVAVAGHWQRVEPCTRRRIMKIDGPLFVPDQQELLALFRLFGRPKDAPRIRALMAEAAGRAAAPAR
ncbi:hypothetical protein [uncultured Sphingomonas sp.]|uniref:hypothetical protein n=1 Tax=uncultured Sphingomonas sp. TaxID=158754 RepID=UPI0025EB55D2|nr:hypothetical protein [uncultured Sphingomonas sp.]